MKKRFISILAAAALTMTSCAPALSEPSPGDEAAPVYDPSVLTAAQRLLQTGEAVPASATDPAVLGLETSLMVNGELISGPYFREEPISLTGAYTQLEGIITFRGNNYRSDASFGVAEVSDGKLTKAWETTTGKLPKTTGSGYWSGSGWTGQPIIIRWAPETRSAMNIYAEKQNDGLTEVIYATMDGKVYFLDLADGTPTRDTIDLGYPVKGTGSLYPTGVPLYFVGAGDSMGEDCARTFVIDLIKGEVIYEYGADDPFAPREDNDSFTAFDSSPLIDADTDTLIQPGENGILYTTRLNTVWDGESVSIAPSEQVKLSYTTARSGVDAYWLGMEGSASVWDHYLYVPDNCGDLLCIDLNTMEPVWAQDIVDDSNASPVFEEDAHDDTGYIYIAPSLHWTGDSSGKGEVPIFKLNAATGEVVWRRSYPCETVSGLSGGVQATALPGKHSLEDRVYFAVARAGGREAGKLVCLSKETGGEIWSVSMANYTWSSPVAVYDSAGEGYIVLCDSEGNMFLLDGATGTLLDSINLGANIEASPAVFGSTIVVGTRGERIFGITIG